MDTKIDQLLTLEERRQQETITLIPSENYASSQVRKLVGSVLMNKYSEGYPGKRYYQGNTFIDQLETLAKVRAKKLFGVEHANVQPYSGSPANMAVLWALAGYQDTIMGMELASGGHLTHGQPKVTFSGTYFQSIQFKIGSENMISSDAVVEKQLDIEGPHLIDYGQKQMAQSTSGHMRSLIDYREVARLASTHRPKVIIVGTTAYPFILDWQRFGEIARSVDAYLVADISHVAGLIVGGVYPSPKDSCHVITTTTHKTLRGPRAAMIMVTQKGLEKDEKLAQKMDRAVFPGLQGGPHDNTTAAIAQCLAEAARPDFSSYAKKIITNAQILASSLIRGGLSLIGGGTQSHLMLVDLRPLGLSGNIVAEALEAAGIVTNRNSLPGDTSPFYPSGIRLGTPAVTTRGMGEKEMEKIALWIIEVVGHVAEVKLPDLPKDRSQFLSEFRQNAQKDKFLTATRNQIRLLCKEFPVPKSCF